MDIQATNYFDEPITWSASLDPEYPYESTYDGIPLRVRINDFPSEHLYSLLAKDTELASFDGWPLRWKRDANEIVTKFVVVCDLSRYGIITRLLEDLAGSDAVRRFHDRLHGLVREALYANALTAPVLFESTGDGAIVVLNSAREAHFFAETLQRHAEAQNLSRQEFAKLRFRIGIAKGELLTSLGELQESTRTVMTGSVIAKAKHLEAACRTGEVLMAEDVWADLKPDGLRKLYAEAEMISAKRGQSYSVYRRNIVVADSPAPTEPGVTTPLIAPESVSFHSLGHPYLEALRFAQLVLFLFHQLDSNGLRAFESAASIIYKAPEARLPDLIMACQQEWERSKAMRAEIDRALLQRLSTLIPQVEADLRIIMADPDRETEKQISTGFAQLDRIKHDINSYQAELVAVSAHDSPAHGFSASDPDLKIFATQAMALSRTVDKLIASAVAFNTNLLDAMEIDPRLNLAGHKRWIELAGSGKRGVLQT